MPSTKRRSVKKPIIVCGQCKLEVREEEESDIQCDKCAKTFHSLCTKLDKRQYERLIENESEEYVCHLCDESDGSLRKELTLIKTKLNKLDQLDTLQQSMTFMSQQFDDIMRGIAENNKKLLIVQKENQNLKAEINDLKKTVKLLNDDRVKNNCIVNGIDHFENMKAVDAIISVMNHVGVDLKADEVDDAFFIKRKPNQKKQSMVVKLNSTKSKQKIMSSKPKLKENEATKTVYINDYLSKETLGLLNHAQSLKTVGYRGVYARAGRVYAKMSELSRPKLIHSADDVDNLLLEATTARSRGRRSVRYEVEEEPGDSDVQPNSEYLSPS